MLEFHTPTMEDKPWIDEVLVHSKHRGCIYTFAQLMLWAPRYNTAVCRYKDALLIVSGEQHEYAIYPAGRYDIREVMEQYSEYFAQRGLPLRIAAAERWQMEELMEEFPDRFEAEESRDDFDYIYNAEDLINLSGKKYHGKRNHIAKFTRAHPDWTFEEVVPENTADAARMAQRWCEENGCDEGSGLAIEACAIQQALSKREVLGLVGGIVRVDGEAVALSMGERLNEDTLVVHFEKALAEYSEAYTVINREFAARFAQGYRYINREEDLGIEGLRKAKLSYRPAILLEKFYITEKQ
ncbi:MAG: DUF2156 domain-containing protein [Clostridia bacterium]|nr:DUF2156 domain-containing protein [Clostridia bacterium]